jgi:signal recognition particle receptor subunit beta
MVLFNYATRELTAKIVYYGPGLCGKTTNLETIHKGLPEKTRGKMLSLATQTDRTLFFDFLPLELGSIKGMKTRVQLYTVPGQVFYDATRKLVLKGADGVVFVVDSQTPMLESNLESWENLKQNLLENGLNINSIPVVLQYNKRDLPNILPVKTLNEKINTMKLPYHEAVALTGEGVQETLKTAARVVLLSLAQRFMKQVKEDEEQVEDLEEVETDPSTFYSSAPLGETSEGPTAQEFEELEELQEVQTAPEPVVTAAGPVAAQVAYGAQAVLNEVPSVKTKESIAPILQQPAQMEAAVSVKPQAQVSVANELAESIPEVQEVVVPVDIALDKSEKEVTLKIQIHLKIKVHRE